MDRLNWNTVLGSKKAKFVPARSDTLNPGVLDEDNNPTNPPHFVFVDDDTYAEVFDIERIEQTIAASIEAMFIILGPSDLTKRQDPVSWDKLEDLTISYCKKF